MAIYAIDPDHVQKGKAESVILVLIVQTRPLQFKQMLSRQYQTNYKTGAESRRPDYDFIFQGVAFVVLPVVLALAEYLTSQVQ